MSIVHLDPVMGIFDRDCAHIDKASLQLLVQIQNDLVQLSEMRQPEGLLAGELQRVAALAQALTLRLTKPKGDA